MQKIVFSLFLIVLFSACKKEQIIIGTNANDLFIVENKGAQMPVLVQGNTAQKAIILVVHGGPGSDAMKTMNGSFMDTLEQKYAVAYWDQRNAGSTQGGANHDNLTVETMTEDLKKVILVLKSRYGQDKSVFLYAHSFGGCLSASFLTIGDNQKLVKGWINIDGATNFKLIQKESAKLQKSIGESEIAAGKNVTAWQPIVDFAKNNLNGNLSIANSETLSQNAYSAIRLIDNITKANIDRSNDLAQSPNSLWSGIVNFQSVYINSGMEAELHELEFASKLNKVSTPTLCLFGKYDFVVPPAVGDEVIKNLSSSFKKKVIFETSGHDPYLTETEKLNKEVVLFVENFK